MGLITAIISGASAIIGASVVKVIADDVKEWIPLVTKQLLNIAVRRLPEDQRERFTEEWAAHLAAVPGVIGKVAVSLQFQVVAFGARSLDEKVRLEARPIDEASALVRLRRNVVEVDAMMKEMRALARGHG